MIVSTSKKYLSSDTTMPPDAYYPDAVLDAFAGGTLKNAPQFFAPDAEALPPRAGAITKPLVSYEQSRKLILDALDAFDPGLGDRARKIFDNGFDAAVKNNAIEGDDETVSLSASQWRLKKVDPGALRMMRSLPAMSAASPGKDPANPNPRAVVQFEYDGTVTSTIYLAHELGHAMADAAMWDRAPVAPGEKPAPNAAHLDELQAYLVQHIIYDALRTSPDRALAAGAQQQFAITMASNLQLFPPAQKELDAQAAGEGGSTAAIKRLHERPAGILTALGLFDLAKASDAATRHDIVETVLGARGPKDVTDLLDGAGVKTPADMARFANAVVQSALTPLPPARQEQGRGLTGAFAKVSPRLLVADAAALRAAAGPQSAPKPA